MKPLSKILRFIIAWFATFFISVIIVAFIPSDMIDETAMAFIGDFLVLVLPIITGVFAAKDRDNDDGEDLANEYEPPPTKGRATLVKRTMSHKTTAPSTKSIADNVTDTKMDRNLAKELLEKAKILAEKINLSTDVFSFTSSFRQMREAINKLIYLNEQKNIFMYPSPRSELEKIESNMEATIHDLICRSVDAIPGYGKDWADKVDQLLNEIETDKFISGYMTQTPVSKN